MIEAFIAEHPLSVWTGVMVLGAILHWGKKYWMGEAPGNPVEYWLLDRTANGLGAVGALVVAFFGVWGTDILAGSTPQLLLISGWTAGWAIDSLVNKSSPEALEIAALRKKEA